MSLFEIRCSSCGLPVSAQQAVQKTFFLRRRERTQGRFAWDDVLEIGAGTLHLECVAAFRFPSELPKNCDPI